MNIVQRAKFYAEIAHGGQVYNEEVPYTVHLQNVVATLERFGLGHCDEIMCAGWLHDSLEDTKTSYTDIRKRFGEQVAEMVYAVTDERGRNRHERHLKTYPKIRGNQGATALKLADRIANVEYGLASGGKTKMYEEEFQGFVDGIYTPPEAASTYGIAVARMWAHLGRLLGKTDALPR